MILHGDCLEMMNTLPDCSVDCVITSPPYWQLRDYGWSGQWGLEKTYQEYLEHLWQMMDEVKRVLKDTGTAWVNLGDTFARGSRGKDGTEQSCSNNRVCEPISKPEYGIDKCLLLIPHRFAIGCIDRGWIVRNDIIWAKRNGMPESVTDRFSKKHEYFFFMVKSQKYYFDLDGARDRCSIATVKRYDSGWNGETKRGYVKGARNNMNKFMNSNDSKSRVLENGKNPGSVSDFWDIPTMPSNEKHYATFNTRLIDKPIIAGCPVGGVILDPFCGTGTTLARAVELGRKAIGIEGSAEYIKIAESRLAEAERNQLLFVPEKTTTIKNQEQAELL